MTTTRVEVFRVFRFEAAHWLPGVPEGHKDRRIHGHSYQVTVRVRGPIDDRTGYACDFSTIKESFAAVDARLDHRCLNDVAGLENPTCENIAGWIWWQLAPTLDGLASVEVRESPDAGCVYSGGTGKGEA